MRILNRKGQRQWLFTTLSFSGYETLLILAPSKEGLPFYTALQKTLLSWSSEFVGFTNPQQFFDIESYRKLVVEAGYQIRALHYLYHESRHENRQALQKWIEQWLPHAKQLSHSKRGLFMDELISNYLIEIGQSPERQDSVEWSEYVLIVQAKKNEEAAKGPDSAFSDTSN